MIQTHYWAPIDKIQNYLADFCLSNNYRRIIDVGAGYAPFKLATELIDAEKRVPDIQYHILDINKDKLPYEDKEIDFLYCRHTLEDIYNPMFAIQEFSRVAKAGYIETPSLIAECSKGIDGGNPVWRGYQQHRHFVWCENNSLSLCAKYPIIEHFDFDNDDINIEMLNNSPFFWNTYYLWRNNISFKLFEHDKDFVIYKDYKEFLSKSMEKSLTNAFEWKNIT